MGRIKTSFIKHVGKDLVERYADKFSTDFEKNKEVVKEVVTIRPKRLRNIITGYITALKKQQKT